MIACQKELWKSHEQRFFPRPDHSAVYSSCFKSFLIYGLIFTASEWTQNYLLAFGNRIFSEIRKSPPRSANFFLGLNFSDPQSSIGFGEVQEFKIWAVKVCRSLLLPSWALAVTLLCSAAKIGRNWTLCNFNVPRGDKIQKKTIFFVFSKKEFGLATPIDSEFFPELPGLKSDHDTLALG